MLDHWRAFHMQKGLCVRLPCIAAELFEGKGDKAGKAHSGGSGASARGAAVGCADLVFTSSLGAIRHLQTHPEYSQKANSRGRATSMINKLFMISYEAALGATRVPLITRGQMGQIIREVWRFAGLPSQQLSRQQLQARVAILGFEAKTIYDTPEVREAERKIGTQHEGP